MKRAIKTVMLMCMLILGISFMMSNTAYATGEGNPRILIENYSISGDEIVPGEEFELTLKVRNTSMYFDAFTVVISVLDSSKSVFPIYGDSNQAYIDRVYARSSTEVIIPLKAADTIETSVIPIELYITFNDDHYVDKQYGTSYLYLPVRLDGDVNITSCEVPEQAALGTKARVSVTYENPGTSRLSNVKMHITSNDEEKTIDLYNLEGGSQNTAEAYLECGVLGEMPIAISFAYENESGERFETEETFYSVFVQENEQYSAATRIRNINAYRILTVISIVALIGVTLIILLMVRRKYKQS